MHYCGGCYRSGSSIFGEPNCLICSSHFTPSGFILFYRSTKLPYLAFIPLTYMGLWIGNVLPNPDAIPNIHWSGFLNKLEVRRQNIFTVPNKNPPPQGASGGYISAFLLNITVRIIRKTPAKTDMVLNSLVYNRP